MNVIQKFLKLFNLTIEDIVIVTKQIIWVMAGAAANYGLEWVSGKDFGVGGAMIAAVFALLARKSIDTPVKDSTGLQL